MIIRLSLTSIVIYYSYSNHVRIALSSYNCFSNPIIILSDGRSSIELKLFVISDHVWILNICEIQIQHYSSFYLITSEYSTYAKYKSNTIHLCRIEGISQSPKDVIRFALVDADKINLLTKVNFDKKIH